MLDADKINEILKFVSSPIDENRAESIGLLESEMFKHDQLDIPVDHRFHGDMYMREITILEDTILTGRIHKFDHFDIMLSGDISVSTSDGTVKRMTGLNIMKGYAGKKRAGYAHKDTHWITIHSAQEQDPENMVEFLTVESLEEFEIFNEQIKQIMKQIKQDEQTLTDHAEMICSKEEICQ